MLIWCLFHCDIIQKQFQLNPSWQSSIVQSNMISFLSFFFIITITWASFFFDTFFLPLHITFIFNHPPPLWAFIHVLCHWHVFKAHAAPWITLKLQLSFFYFAFTLSDNGQGSFSVPLVSLLLSQYLLFWWVVADTDI